MDARIEAARELIAKAHLRDIRLVESECGTRIRRTREINDPALLLSHEATSTGQMDRHFHVLAEFGCQIADEADLPNTEADEEVVATPPVWVRAKFELSYRVPKGLAFEKETLEGFAETNGLFNAWPYFREFVQSTVARMGLPPILIPLFRILSESEEPEITEDMDAEESNGGSEE